MVTNIGAKAEVAISEKSESFDGEISIDMIDTLVNVYVDLVVFTRIAGTLKTKSGGYWT